MSDTNDGPIEIASPNTHEEEPVLADTSSAVTTVDQTVAVKKDGAVTTTKKRRRPARPQVSFAWERRSMIKSHAKKSLEYR